MRRTTVLIALLALAFVAGEAQSHSSKSKSDSSGPSKVTGPSKKLADGLEYWDIKTGTGKAADKGNTVTVNYTGWLTSGKMFDTSVGKAPFTVDNLGNAPVIKGWNEGIVGMKVG